MDLERHRYFYTRLSVLYHFLKGPKYVLVACRVSVHFLYLEREGLINIGRYCFDAFIPTGGFLFLIFNRSYY